MKTEHAFSWAAGSRQMMRYALVGVLSNGIGYALYLIITAAGGTPKVTMSVLYGAAVVVGFFGNRRFTFRHLGRLAPSGLRYLAAQGVGYLLNFSLLAVFVDRMGYPHQLVQAIAIVIVAGFLFLVLRWLVFPSSGAAGGAPP